MESQQQSGLVPQQQPVRLRRSAPHHAGQGHITEPGQEIWELRPSRFEARNGFSTDVQQGENSQ